MRDLARVARDQELQIILTTHSPCPRCANALNRCAIARCAGSPTARAVTGGKIVKTQNRCALIRPLRRCGLSANMVVADRTVMIAVVEAGSFVRAADAL
jgi:tRNA(Arg) A34 adenosine deaminase TadA